MILCPFNSKIKINNRVTRSRRVNARMETDDLPLSNLSHRKERERERRLRGSPIAGFFRTQDLPYLNKRDLGYQSKMAAKFGAYMGSGIAEKKPSRLRDWAKIKDGVMGSEDCIKVTLSYVSN